MVNNAASALVLALNTVAEGMEVVISRGELVEIGGSFRIPDILAKSGARLREVGTTNRTHLDDYRTAIGPAHRRDLEGAPVELRADRLRRLRPPPPSLRAPRGTRVPFIYDVGSGLLADLAAFGLTAEPRVPDAVATGAGLVIFSGDKLLGGPQAGCLVGRSRSGHSLPQNPMARAAASRQDDLRRARGHPRPLSRPGDRAAGDPGPANADHFCEGTANWRQDWRRQLLPPAPLARAPPDRRACRWSAAAPSPRPVCPRTLVVLDPGPRGADSLALSLRLGDPSVVARVAEGMVVLDPRTIPEAAFPAVAGASAAAYAE